MRELFADREFVAYFAARQSRVLAYRIESVAIGWQVFLLRHQPLDLGLVGLMLFIPEVLFALPAGLMADRFDRRIVCIACTLGEVLGEGAFVALALSGTKSLSAYLSAVALIGTAHALGIPAERSLLAGIVRSHHYVRAQALTASIAQAIAIAGPALGGGLVALGTPIAFGTAGASYAAAAAAFFFLRPRDVAREDVPLWRAASEGVRFIFARPIVLGAISLDLFAVLFGGAIALLPIYADTILHIGPVGLGGLRSAPALGGAVVALLLARHPIERRAGPILLWSVAGFGVATIVFGLSHNLLLSLVALAATGGFDMVSVVIRSALVQLGTPDAMRGRVGAVENIFVGASNELGAFESGALAALIGTEGSVVFGGAATLVVIALCMLLFPQLRRYDRLVELPPVELIEPPALR